jgi:hypothetical protein
VSVLNDGHTGAAGLFHQVADVEYMIFINAAGTAIAVAAAGSCAALATPS